MILWLAIACVEVPKNPLAVDDDGDGYTEFDGDCDDADPNLLLQSNDGDCDGVLSADDCDDTDSPSPLKRRMQIVMA